MQSSIVANSRQRVNEAYMVFKRICPFTAFSDHLSSITTMIPYLMAIQDRIDCTLFSQSLRFEISRARVKLEPNLESNKFHENWATK